MPHRDPDAVAKAAHEDLKQKDAIYDLLARAYGRTKSSDHDAPKRSSVGAEIEALKNENARLRAELESLVGFRDLLAACEVVERYLSQTLISTVVNSWDYEAKRHFRECENHHRMLVDAIKKAKGER